MLASVINILDKQRYSLMNGHIYLIYVSSAQVLSIEPARRACWEVTFK